MTIFRHNHLLLMISFAVGALIACSAQAGPGIDETKDAVPLSNPIQAGQCGRLWWWIIDDEDVFPPAGASDAARSYANLHQARATLNLVAAGAERYCYANNGHYAEDIQDIISYSAGLPRGARCRVGEIITDPWGTPISYSLRQGEPIIASAGPDRTFGTRDDIMLPKPGDPQGEWLNGREVCQLE